MESIAEKSGDTVRAAALEKTRAQAGSARAELDGKAPPAAVAKS
jgi:hypothetical protein